MMTVRPELIELHAEDWFTISRYGPVAAIRGLPGLYPNDLMHQQVSIDGKLYFVWGVETHPVGNHRKRCTGKDFAVGVYEV
jgi:hypothetical protein